MSWGERPSPVRNQPISYDEHGRIPLTVPFAQIPRGDISLYFQLSTLVGAKTCGQTCAHCFYITEKEARGRSMDTRAGLRVVRDLEARGFSVFPMMADSFANKGEFLRIFGNTHVRNYVELGEAGEEVPTRTMSRGEMWTSGAPLLGPDWEELLCTGIRHGFGTVTITFHGVPDARLQLLPRETYPIKNVFAGQDTERVIARIHDFNRRLAAGEIAPFEAGSAEARALGINLGVTVGKHNHTSETLQRYVRYFGGLGVSVVRFNCFHDHGGLHPHLVLDRQEVAAVYREVRRLHDEVPFPFQLGMSEDFGTSGIEVMGFPGHVGVCRAGRQLFAVVPDPAERLSEDADTLRERVGTVAACVDAFKPVVGRLVRETNKARGEVTHDIEFFEDVIEALNQKRLDGTYQDGCYAPEMLADVAASRPARVEPPIRRGTDAN